MPQNTHLDLVSAETELLSTPAGATHDPQVLIEKAEELGRSLTWLPNTPSSSIYADRCRRIEEAFKPIFGTVDSPRDGAQESQTQNVSDDYRWLYDNERLIYTEIQNGCGALRDRATAPHARNAKGEVVPRVLAVAEAYLDAVSYQFNEQELILFLNTFQKTVVLQLRELWTLSAALKLVLLEQIAARGKQLIASPADDSLGVGTCVRSLREVGHASWKDVLEPAVMIDQVLRRDPAGAYAQMDFESRNAYRLRISKIAERSDCSEFEVANAMLALAQEAAGRTYDDPRIAQRESHVGYYLVDKGAPELYQKIRFRPTLGRRIQIFLRRHPDEFYIPGIVVLTLAIVSAATLLLTNSSTSLPLILFSMLVLLLPSSQSAVQLMNYLVTAILPAEILPKLDFSEAVPDNCVTLVAVPSLLLSEKQVRGLIENLEVRYLGNHDPNIHFALVTDLPDSREPAREENALIDLCSELIRELNEKYSSLEAGTFFLFHRHRVYNPREKSWMGWERKRGKLLDLNKLLRGQFDSFPVKIGELSILPSVRFVLTLDSDTELPRGTAHRMIGTLAHPLNQAVIDPEKNIVVAGYGILQPRVGVSVSSTSRSRLAAIYAGETGFDIYTRAISDAYQDLYGEGSFTGKGIYDVDAVQSVLDRRFPHNALLSHDLIEGAYARAGLASDIEVIEDYPSRYNAHNKRKHRWLRGDWQIAEWLLREVPDESGNPVPNPISLISWWKIFDNLRRSLVEPAMFLLLVVGWFMLSRPPWEWTLATLCILFVPAWFQCLFNLVRAVVEWSSSTARDAMSGLYTANVNLFFTLTFLAHQMLISLDAMVRALVRRFVTQSHLLEWETAAEAELGTGGQTPIDIYLNWIPLLSLAIAILVWAVRPQALAAALPILILWAASKLVSMWLNQSPEGAGNRVSPKDIKFLRRASLHTWRYFAEYSTAEHNWLIPDNVQEEPAAIAARVSPTNVGLLLNGRQAACELGYLTVPEFVGLTQKTLATISALKKYRGHVLNWYDTRTLEPLKPQFVSSVDNGNLLASLWTLQQGNMDRLHQPILQPCLAEGCLDYLRAMADAHVLPSKVLSACERQNRTEKWLQSIIDMPDEIFTKAEETIVSSKLPVSTKWLVQETKQRVLGIRMIVNEYTPWRSPDFTALREDSTLNLALMENISLEKLPAFIDKTAQQIKWNLDSASSQQKALYEQFRERLTVAKANVLQLIADLKATAALAGKLANAMDFKLLFDERRKLLSVGFDLDANKLNAACYDLLATESRTAVFVAIAKEDIPQESWFLLGRAHTLDGGRPVLLSWTGTIFEYLMPSLWMSTFPNTLLERSRIAAVKSQQTYAAHKGVPWGISESAYFQLDQSQNYQYYAFGLPQLALRKPEINGLVISPYSTFLGLDVDPAGALRNLRTMADMGWFGVCGFYESADFTAARGRFWNKRPNIVRCWMAHHQGMSLLALANFLNDDVMRKWFHAERRVQATELLLHEKPVAHVSRRDIPRRLAVA